MKIEPWDESFLDIEDYQVERSAVRAAIEAIRQAQRFGTDYTIWDNGQVKSMSANETAPYEQTLLRQLDALNERIAQLQTLPESDLVLRETAKPAKKP
jgi:hypothetical protein